MSSDTSYDRIVERLLKGRVIPFLGAGVNLCNRSLVGEWHPLAGVPPSGWELSKHLATKFNYPGDGFDLRLISAAKDVTDLPTKEAGLIIVAALQQVLHFRILNARGVAVVNTDETQLHDKEPEIAELKSQLSALWNVSPIPRADEERVIAAVRSIVGHTPRDLPSLDLLRVSQFVEIDQTEGTLYDELHELFNFDFPPTPVHEFLASFPAMRRRKGLKDRYQIILTTNYDDVLERAFRKAGEPFDVVFYDARAKSPNFGMFWHRSSDGTIDQLIASPNVYSGLQGDRTVILKIHGAVERGEDSGTRDSYVISEDDYIDYMAHERQHSTAFPSLSRRSSRRAASFSWVMAFATGTCGSSCGGSGRISPSISSRGPSPRTSSAWSRGSGASGTSRSSTPTLRISSRPSRRRSRPWRRPGGPHECATIPVQGPGAVRGRRLAHLLRPDRRDRGHRLQPQGVAADDLLRSQRRGQELGAPRGSGTRSRRPSASTARISAARIRVHLREPVARGAAEAVTKAVRRRSPRPWIPKVSFRVGSKSNPQACWGPSNSGRVGWKARSLIVLDQFEEYFLYHPDEGGSGTFAAEFPLAVNRPGLKVHFMLSLRVDALARLDRFKDAIPDLFGNLLALRSAPVVRGAGSHQGACEGFQRRATRDRTVSRSSPRWSKRC